MSFRTNVLEITSPHSSVSIERVTNYDHKFVSELDYFLASTIRWEIVEVDYHVAGGMLLAMTSSWLVLAQG